MKQKRFTFKRVPMQVGDVIQIQLHPKYDVTTPEFVAVLDYDKYHRVVTVLLPYHLGRFGADRQWKIMASDVESVSSVLPAAEAVPLHSGEDSPLQPGDRVSFPYRFRQFHGKVIAALRGTVAVRNSRGEILHGGTNCFTRVATLKPESGHATN